MVWDPRVLTSLVPDVFGAPPRGTRTRNETDKNRPMYAHNKINGWRNRWNDCSARGWFTRFWDQEMFGRRIKGIRSVQIESTERTRRRTDPIQRRSNKKEGGNDKVVTRVKSGEVDDTHNGNRIC